MFGIENMPGYSALPVYSSGTLPSGVGYTNFANLGTSSIASRVQQNMQHGAQVLAPQIAQQQIAQRNAQIAQQQAQVNAQVAADLQRAQQPEPYYDERGVHHVTQAELDAAQRNFDTPGSIPGYVSPPGYAPWSTDPSSPFNQPYITPSANFPLVNQSTYYLNNNPAALQEALNLFQTQFYQAPTAAQLTAYSQMAPRQAPTLNQDQIDLQRGITHVTQAEIDRGQAEFNLQKASNAVALAAQGQYGYSPQTTQAALQTAQAAYAPYQNQPAAPRPVYSPPATTYNYLQSQQQQFQPQTQYAPQQQTQYAFQPQPQYTLRPQTQYSYPPQTQSLARQSFQPSSRAQQIIANLRARMGR